METYITLRVTRDSHDIREVNTIRVQDLIDRLHDFPKDAKVVFSFDGGNSFGSISSRSLISWSVETYEEEREREEREREEEENEILVCPHCGSDNIIVSVDYKWRCLDCGERFKKANIINKNNI